MRIIGGQFRGKKLHGFRGKEIRPTSDRLRESIFNIIHKHVRNATVLDLYAGTGALGVEALSRGARSAMFIDNHKPSLALIQRNIEACGLENKTKIYYWNIEKNLNCLCSSNSLFNLVFMDPPYAKGLVKISLLNLSKTRMLTSNACIVVEHTPRERIANDLTDFVYTDQRIYGKTCISFLIHVSKPKRSNINNR